MIDWLALGYISPEDGLKQIWHGMSAEHRHEIIKSALYMSHIDIGVEIPDKSIIPQIPIEGLDPAKIETVGRTLRVRVGQEHFPMERLYITRVYLDDVKVETIAKKL